MDKKCVNCFYSEPSLNEELVVCTYLSDIISNSKKFTKQDSEIAKYFVDLTNFSGNVYKAFDKEKNLKICVEKENNCGKFFERNSK